MRNLSLVAILLLVAFLNVGNLYAQTNPSHVYVNGYYRSNGTYVQPHYRTAPNNTVNDNFSTLGNVNPYTGELGHVLPDNKSTSAPRVGSADKTTNQLNSSNSSGELNSGSIPAEFDSYFFNQRMKELRKWEEIQKGISNTNRGTISSSYSDTFNSGYSKSVTNSSSGNGYFSSLDEDIDTGKAIFYHDRYSSTDKLLMEQSLDKLGYKVGAVDGSIDASTIKAIRHFQANNRLKVDGQLGPASLKKLVIDFN
jgi:hypothetical protein